MLDIHANVAPAVATLEAISPKLSRTLTRNFRTLGQQYERLIKGDLLSGNVLDARTGAGRRSIFYRVEQQGGGQASSGSFTGVGGVTDVVLTVGANLAIAPYMRLLAYGGTIVPKKSQFLTIPLDAAKTASGVARFSARDVIGNPQAHGFSSTFTRMHGDGGTIFGVKYKRSTIEGQRVLVEGGRVVPLFALKKSVKIPARNYLHIAQTFLGAETRQAVTDAVAEATR